MVKFFSKKTRSWISADDVCHPARTFSQPDTHAIPRTRHHLTLSSLCLSLSLSLCLFAVPVCLSIHSFFFFGLLPTKISREEHLVKQLANQITLDGSVHGTAQNYDLSHNWLALHSDTVQKASFFFSTRYLFSMFARKNQLNRKRNKRHDS